MGLWINTISLNQAKSEKPGPTINKLGQMMIQFKNEMNKLENSISFSKRSPVEAEPESYYSDSWIYGGTDMMFVLNDCNRLGAHVEDVEEIPAEEIIGYCSVHFDEEDKSAVVMELFIDSKFRGRGYGKFLMRYVGHKLGHEYNLGLTVHNCNKYALKIYQDLGFDIPVSTWYVRPKGYM